MSDYGLEAACYEINLVAAQLAKRAAADFPGRWVAGPWGR